MNARIIKIIAMVGMLTTSLFSAEKNMLFIGNSFTMRHDIPKLVKTLLEEGDRENTVNTEIVGYGGRNLFWHWEMCRSYNRLKSKELTKEQWDSEISALKQLKTANEFPAVFLEYHTALSRDDFHMKSNPRFKIPTSSAMGAESSKYFGMAAGLHNKWITENARKGDLDFVVLQSWRDVTESAGTGYMKYAQQFGAIANEIGARPVLYLTAPNSQNATPVTAAINKEELLGTCRIASKGEKEMNAVVVPVPLALMLAQESTDPIARTLTFRYKNDFHPNKTMAYLTACTFYAALTGKSPEGLKFNTVSETKLQNIHGEAISADNKGEVISSKVDPDGGPPTTVFDDETRLFLQRTAWKAVQLYRSGNF
jgi:hypothetical protein